MNKKILVGSIVAVVLLTLVSFSSVVGFQSVKSDSKIASPLFSIRNKKGDISSNYLCKGKQINILLTKRNDKAKIVEKFVNRIKMMDEKSLNSVVNIIFNKLKNDGKIVNTNKNDIKDLIYFFSENPEISKSFLLQDKEKSVSNEITYGHLTPIRCIFALIFQLIENFLIILVLFLYFLFIDDFPTSAPFC